MQNGQTNYGFRAHAAGMRDMSPLALSVIVFAALLAGILVGVVLRSALPKTHLSKDTPGRRATWRRLDSNNWWFAAWSPNRIGQGIL